MLAATNHQEDEEKEIKRRVKKIAGIRLQHSTSWVIRQALPPAPATCLVSGNLKEPDALGWALHGRDILPENCYNPSVDLFFYQRPKPQLWHSIWLSTPIVVHDAEFITITLDQVKEGLQDFKDDVMGILSNHPGPVGCFRLDCSHCPAPEALDSLMGLLSDKKVQEVIIVNQDQPVDMPFPLHLLNSSSLTSMGLGFFVIQDCYLDTAEDLAAAPCWYNLTQLTLIGCSFDVAKFCDLISRIRGLQRLAIALCELSSSGCDPAGITVNSTSLITLQLWECWTKEPLRMGHMPRLATLNMGIISSEEPAGDVQQVTIDLGSTPDTMQELHGLVLHRHAFQFDNYQSFPVLRSLDIALSVQSDDEVDTFLMLLWKLPRLKCLAIKVNNHSFPPFIMDTVT